MSWFHLIVVLVLLCGIAGCATPAPQDGAVLSDEVIHSFFERPKDPRGYGLTVYQDRQGDPVFSGANRLHPEQYAQLECQDKKRGREDDMSIVVLLTGRNGEQIDTLLDTAQQVSWITMPAADLLSAVPLGPPPYVRSSGFIPMSMRGYAVMASKLKFDQMHMENVVLYMLVPDATLGALKRGRVAPDPQIVLGQDVLSRFSFVRYDFMNQNVILASSTKYEPDRQGVVATVPLITSDGMPMISGFLNRRKARFILDVSGDYEAICGVKDAREDVTVTLGDLVVCGVTVQPSDALGLNTGKYVYLGRHFLRRFVVVFDYAANQLVFERPLSVELDPADVSEPSSEAVMSPLADENGRAQRSQADIDRVYRLNR
ncbi:MAG: hypothetical protein EOL87_15055 [Spartobacteria bacterium]|nr:hypothetical protein [Spartobacteria bacterium]